MAYCDRCGRYFPHERALSQHLNNSSAHNICDECDKDFGTWNALEQHYVNSPRHHYCQRCDKHYGTRAKLEQHFVRFHHYCRSHRQFFETSEGLRQHYIQSGDHYYCRFCSILFEDVDDFLEHGDDYHFVCSGCSKIFKTRQAMLSHKECDHYYCKTCDRVFNSKSNLDNHLNSSLHKQPTIKCPGRGCTKMFVSISALILHAESGTCPSGITRKQVNDFAVRLDRQNVITNPNRLLTDSSGARMAPPESEQWATSRSWNGFAYECALCHAEFRTLDSLNKHLKSPRHAAAIYHCPKVGCRTEFTALSALIQHIERGGCGVGNDRQVKGIMEGLTRNMRSLAF